jgi:hypothetical protein
MSRWSGRVGYSDGGGALDVVDVAILTNLPPAGGGDWRECIGGLRGGVMVLWFLHFFRS